MVAVEALVVRGETEAGMAFHGTLISLSATTMRIQPQEGRDFAQMGIPIEAIRSLGFALPTPPSSTERRALEELGLLLDRFDEATVKGLLDWLDTQVAEGAWVDIYRLAERLSAHPVQGPQQIRARLLKARCLYELGLATRLESELAALNATVPLLEAPPLLCWLNAQLSLTRNRPEEARFWARLPHLQIPSRSDPLARELADLAETLTPPGNPLLP